MAIDHLVLLRGDVDRIGDALLTGPADAPVAGCPGWTVRDLVVHLARIHRWVIGALETVGPPTIDEAADPTPTDDAALVGWLRGGADRMIALISATPPDAPTWHPFPVEPKVAGLWARRQAQEASVHRWDAEHAIGLEARIDPEVADDGIDEYWTVMLPRLVVREGLAVPSSSFTVEATDAGRSWHVVGRDGRVHVTDRPGAATLRGTAQDVLLRLWGRPGEVETTGDAQVAEDWLSLGGA